MPKIHHVKKARVLQSICDACGQQIAVGDAYKYFSFYRGRPRQRHEACPMWRPSQLTSNDKLSQLYAACEDAEDELASLSYDDGDQDAAQGIRAALEAAGEAVDEVAEMYREMASNMEEGFGHPTEQSEEAESNGDELDNFANELRGWEPDDFDEDGEESRDDWFASQVEAATEVVGNSPL